MLRFVSFLVIASAIYMWHSGESPRSLLHKLNTQMDAQSRHMTAGQGTDWGN